MRGARGASGIVSRLCSSGAIPWVGYAPGGIMLHWPLRAGGSLGVIVEEQWCSSPGLYLGRWLLQCKEA
eukprot:7010716-Pyramimonas_sp.AAC.1